MIIATSSLTTTPKPTTSTSSTTTTSSTTNKNHANEFIPLKLMSSATTTTAATSSTAMAATAIVTNATTTVTPPVVATAANSNKDFLNNREKAVDLVTVQTRYKGPDDFITKVFGTDSVYDNQVTELLNIQSTTTATTVSTNQNATLLLSCEAFIHESIVFLNIPLLMMTDNTNKNYGHNVFDWPTADFQSSISHLIELAEEKTGCNALVVCIDKKSHYNNNKSSVNGLNIVLRAFLYLGFELVHPSVYHHDQTNFVLVGYEL